ncbi:MAG: sulfatase [Pseudomonadales bacterium]
MKLLRALLSTINLLLLCFSVTLSVSADERPNVVLIIGDDISRDFSAYGGPVKTPNIDVLAKNGVLFNNAYTTASSCSPSRNSMITGRYPHNHGAPELHMALPEEQFVFPQLLKDAGYYNVADGKWHMGDVPRVAFDSINDPGYQVDPTGSAHWVQSLQERPKNKPFFMWFAAFDAHRPWEPDAEEIPHDASNVIVPAGVPDTPIARQDIASYYDEVRRFDRYVGYVIKELKTQGVFDNTLILLVGDNGRPFPRNKTTLYENGMNIPFIMHWPNGDIKAGATSSSLVSTIDIAPTILEALGMAAPPQVQGISFLPIARQPGLQTRQLLFGERNWHTQIGVGRMVRQGDYVYFKDFTPTSYSFQMVANTNPTQTELLRLKAEGKLKPEQAELFSTERAVEMLFNVIDDPQQLNNLVNKIEHKALLQHLREKLALWQKRTGDSIPALDQLTVDRHDRKTFERLYKGMRPPTGVVPGQAAGATKINDPGPLK